jgi:hypothetical protein
MWISPVQERFHRRVMGGIRGNNDNKAGFAESFCLRLGHFLNRKGAVRDLTVYPQRRRDVPRRIFHFDNPFLL